MAYCSSCQSNNCSCTEYTLPTGSTGATGATGATGPAGTPGATTLFSQRIDVDTAGTSMETLYTYTLAAAVLDEAGDALIIKAFYSTNNTATGTGSDKVVRIRIAATEITPLGVTTYPAFFPGQLGLHYELKLTRVSTTTVFVEQRFYNTVAFGLGMMYFNVHSPNTNYATYQTVSNLDSATNAITVEANSITAGDITLDYLCIEKIEKV